jgi:hypothetical protein
MNRDAWMLSACVVLLSALCVVAVPLGAAQDAPLPEYWFDDDEWRLLVQYIITADELAAYRRVKPAGERLL